MYGFIVEGFNDESKLRQLIPNSRIVVTKGTRFNNRVRMDINLVLIECSRVYLITDPDKSGDLLAKTILNEFPMLIRINLDPEQCKCYRNSRLKIGLEHCDLSNFSTVLKPSL